MERIKELNGYAKFIILALVVLFAVFTVLYAVTTSRTGYAYEDTILVHSIENGNSVYSGKIKGQSARFAVTPDKVVTFTYGDKTYGPYTVKPDFTAMPEGKHCTHGIEVREKDEIIFRGGYFIANDIRFFYNEDGSSPSIGLSISSSNNGIVTDVNGNIIDTMKPFPGTILDLVEGPELTHKGSWGIWILCTFLAIVTAVSVLFADELFRWRMEFRVQDVDAIKPSDWEITSRYLAWGIDTILVWILYATGLK